MSTTQSKTRKVLDKVKSIPSVYQTYKYPINTTIFIVLVGLFIGLTIYFMKHKSLYFLQDYSNYILYGLGLIMLLSIVILLNQMQNQGSPSAQSNIMGQLFYFSKYLLILGLGVSILVGVIYGLTSGTAISIITLNALLIASIVVGLYLIHSLVSQTTYYKNMKSSGLFSVLYHGIFMIPCILIDGGLSIFKNVKQTKPSTYYLLLAEIVFLGLYFAVPYIYNKISTHNIKVLLDKPHYIDSLKTLGTFEELKASAKDDYKYKYGIAYKFFIDQNLPNASDASITDTEIFNYGNKPRVTFNVKEDILKVTCRKGVDGTTELYRAKGVPRQRWNTMVVNYNSGIMDIFLNGELVATKKNVVPYMTHDYVTSGFDNGIQGGIKEVHYSHEPYTISKIKMM